MFVRFEGKNFLYVYYERDQDGLKKDMKDQRAPLLYFYHSLASTF